MPNKNKTIKQLPPYGRKLLIALQCGYKPTNDVFLFVGQDAWQNAKYFSNWQDVLILPPHRHPDEFDWSIVKGLSVLLRDADNVRYEVIRKLAHSLLSSLASVVYVPLADNPVTFSQDEVNDE
ncbi:MAG: hypothetical protein PVG30_00685 [Gammaproteobacteria bacterium]|jgi:hypothetical protein